MAHIHRLHCVHLNVDFETSPMILKLRSDVVFKKISDSVELHNVSGLTLQPEFVKFNEQIAARDKTLICVKDFFLRYTCKSDGNFPWLVCEDLC